MTEHDIKIQICDICRKMWQSGWVAANDGNVSVKIETNRFLVTPTGVSKNDVTPEMIVKIDHQFSVIDVCQSSVRPSSETKMHLRCYTEREDINAVIHAHPIAATAFAVANKPLDDYSMIETVLTIGSVPVTPYATPSTDEVGDSIAPFLSEHDVLLLLNHGALTVGADLITAYHRMETLEHWAKIILNAHIIGGAKEITRQNIEKLCDMREQYGIIGRHPRYKKYS